MKLMEQQCSLSLKKSEETTFNFSQNVVTIM